MRLHAQQAEQETVFVCFLVETDLLKPSEAKTQELLM